MSAGSAATRELWIDLFPGPLKATHEGPRRIVASLVLANRSRQVKTSFRAIRSFFDVDLSDFRVTKSAALVAHGHMNPADRQNRCICLPHNSVDLNLPLETLWKALVNRKA